MAAIEERAGEVHLALRVQPRASRNALMLCPEGTLRIALTAPPVEGEANAELLRYLADVLGCPARQLRLVRGERSREKVVAISGMSAAALRGILESRAGNGAVKKK